MKIILIIPLLLFKFIKWLISFIAFVLPSQIFIIFMGYSKTETKNYILKFGFAVWINNLKVFWCFYSLIIIVYFGAIFSGFDIDKDFFITCFILWIVLFPFIDIYIDSKLKSKYGLFEVQTKFSRLIKKILRKIRLVS